MHLNLEWDCDLDYNRQRIEYGIYNIECRPRVGLIGRGEMKFLTLRLDYWPGLSKM